NSDNSVRFSSPAHHTASKFLPSTLRDRAPRVGAWSVRSVKEIAMPTLVLVHHDQPLAFALEKIDRDRLYGYIDVQTLDAAGQPCGRAALAADGHTLAGKGDTALAYLSPAGLWRRRDELRAVDPQGAPILPVKATFTCPVPLDTEASIDDYLVHTIQFVYQLV